MEHFHLFCRCFSVRIHVLRPVLKPFYPSESSYSVLDFRLLVIIQSMTFLWLLIWLYFSIILVFLAIILLGLGYCIHSLAATFVPKSADIELLGPWQLLHLRFSPVQSVHCPLQVTWQFLGSSLLLLPPPPSVLVDSLRLLWDTSRLGLKWYLDGARNFLELRSIRSTYTELPLSVACNLCHLRQLPLAGWSYWWIWRYCRPICCQLILCPAAINIFYQRLSWTSTFLEAQSRREEGLD